MILLQATRHTGRSEGPCQKWHRPHARRAAQRTRNHLGESEVSDKQRPPREPKVTMPQASTHKSRMTPRDKLPGERFRWRICPSSEFADIRVTVSFRTSPGTHLRNGATGMQQRRRRPEVAMLMASLLKIHEKARGRPSWLATGKIGSTRTRLQKTHPGTGFSQQLTAM